MEDLKKPEPKKFVPIIEAKKVEVICVPSHKKELQSLGKLGKQE